MSEVVVSKIQQKSSSGLTPEISVAPMMDLTDHHCRYFHRLISPNAVLYTEMVTSQALKFGDHSRLLKYNAEEQPLVLQIAGCDPKDLAYSAKLAQQHGFKEVNINIGCPSDRVQKARIGACLMAAPDLVADCVKAMVDAVDIPVTIKTRIGIDNHDSYEFLTDFIKKTSQAGCNKFIVHARKAWLQGLSPKQNRMVPTLDYNRVYKLKEDFKDLKIILNGGIESVSDVKDKLQNLDGIMIGRAAYHNPYLLAEIEQEIFANNNILSKYEIVDKLHPYVLSHLEQDIPWIKLARHYIGLFKGNAGARSWRQFISESRDINNNNLDKRLEQIITYLKQQEHNFLLRTAV